MTKNKKTIDQVGIHPDEEPNVVITSLLKRAGFKNVFNEDDLERMVKSQEKTDKANSK